MKVSVIIPTYNYGRFLRESIGSVLCQTMDDLEVLVVDDGSTDETPEILSSIAARDARVKPLRICRTGVSDARNFGLERAQGEFHAYLDADDRWLPDKLEVQLRIMEAEPEVGLVFTNAVRFQDDRFFDRDRFAFLGGLNKIPQRPSRDGSGHVIDGDAFLCLLPLPMLAPTPSTTLLRAGPLRGIRWRAGLQKAPDLYYFMQVCRRVKAAYTWSHLVETRRHGENSYTRRFDPLRPFIRALRIILEEPGDPLTPEHRQALRERIGAAWCSLGYYHFWRHHPIGAAWAYGRALSYPGSRLNACWHIAATPAILFLPTHWEKDEAFV